MFFCSGFSTVQQIAYWIFVSKSNFLGIDSSLAHFLLAFSRTSDFLTSVFFVEPFFDLVGMELACEYGMARGNRKARLRRIFMEHFADRFFGFEETGS